MENEKNHDTAAIFAGELSSALMPFLSRQNHSFAKSCEDNERASGNTGSGPEIIQGASTMKSFTEADAAAPQSAPAAPQTSGDLAAGKRKYVARIPLQLQLRVTAVNYSGPARSVNVSVTGLLIETALPLTIGERVILTINHPEGEGSFNICAEVTRVATEYDQSTANGFGIRVLTDDSLIWQNFLRLLVLS